MRCMGMYATHQKDLPLISSLLRSLSHVLTVIVEFHFVDLDLSCTQHRAPFFFAWVYGLGDRAVKRTLQAPKKLFKHQKDFLRLF